MNLQDKRRFKSEWLLNKITEQAELGFKRDILMAQFCNFFGCSFQLAPKFIKELELLGLIEIKENVCYLRRYSQ